MKLYLSGVAPSSPWEALSGVTGLRVALAYSDLGEAGEAATHEFMEGLADVPVVVEATGDLVDVEAYERFLSEWGDGLEMAAAPTRPEPGASLALYREFQAAGHDVTPTFHVGDDWSYLDEYQDADAIILDGLHKHRARKGFQIRWAAEVIRRTDARLYGLGIHTGKVAVRIPWDAISTREWRSGKRVVEKRYRDLGGKGRGDLARDPAAAARLLGRLPVQGSGREDVAMVESARALVAWADELRRWRDG